MRIQITQTSVEAWQSKFTEINSVNLSTTSSSWPRYENVKKEIIQANHLLNHQRNNFFGSMWSVFRGETPAELWCLIDLETKWQHCHFAFLIPPDLETECQERKKRQNKSWESKSCFLFSLFNLYILANGVWLKRDSLKIRHSLCNNYFI